MLTARKPAAGAPSYSRTRMQAQIDLPESSMCLDEDERSRQLMDMVKSKKLIWLVARLFALFISPLQGYKGRGHGSSPITASRPPKP
jgi:hypothetical protein